MKNKLPDLLKTISLDWKIILSIISVVGVGLLYFILQNNTIGFLGLHSIDEYVFHGSLSYMLQSVASGNLPGLFGFGFYQYGFIYFILNLLAALPGFLTDNYSYTIIAPRVITSLFALGSLLYLYKFARLYVSTLAAAFFTIFFVTMPGFWYNATWFHPDWSMTFFVVACLYYLAKDNWQFGTYFKVAVAAYGLALAFKYQAVTALPLLLLYIFYNPFYQFSWASLRQATKRAALSLVTVVSIFIICNPYILHPLGWKAFSGAFVSNMTSNATNHGAASVVSLVDKVTLAIGDFYLNVIFLFILLLASLWLTGRFLKRSEKNFFAIIAINFILNLGYLLFFVNKAWQIYYLPVIVTGLLTLLYYIKPLHQKRQLQILGVLCLAQVLIYGSSYLPILSQSRDATAPDFNTYSAAENERLQAFLLAELQPLVTPSTLILLTPYTPLSFDQLGLTYPQVKLIFGALDRGSIDPAAYLIGQKAYWGDLKSDEELLASFTRADIIILRKDIPFIDTTKLEQLLNQEAYQNSVELVAALYDGTLDYHVLAENELVVIFALKDENS